MAASCVGRNVRQTAGEKAVTLSRRDLRGDRLINGSGNLLVGVCALISYEYSHFGAQAASSSGGKRAIDRAPEKNIIRFALYDEVGRVRISGFP